MKGRSPSTELMLLLLLMVAASRLWAQGPPYQTDDPVPVDLCAWAQGFAAAHTGRSTMIDVGGYYHFKHNPNEQFLFCYGHSIAGQTENYAYAGMYWTWGGQGDNGPDDKKDTATNNWMQRQMHGNFRSRRNVTSFSLN